jgi:iron complex outermembrane receptor protein
MTVKNSSYVRGSKFRFSINNLLDKHSLVGVNPASTASNAPVGGDVLTLLAGRSFSVTITPAYSPKR